MGRRISGGLGRSISGVYLHYASKQVVLVYLMKLTMMDLVNRMERAAADGSDSVERFALMVQSLARCHMHRQDLACVCAAEMRALEP